MALLAQRFHLIKGPFSDAIASKYILIASRLARMEPAVCRLTWHGVRQYDFSLPGEKTMALNGT